MSNIYRALISNNNLTSNYAETQGGGIYMSCLDPYDCKYFIDGVNTFMDNYANMSGGAIFWNDV